uniref:Diamine acetyltransferase 1 n=1 Tax=Hucho hucho TaxID=62062 RepID=A0A4W5PIF6_9TELE
YRFFRACLGVFTTHLVYLDHDSLLVMWTPRNLTLDPLHYSPVDVCGFTSVCPGPVVIGFAMYYFTYDPWIGKLLYLEDFFVMEEYRKIGIGSEILKLLSDMAFKTRCNSMHFVVAEGNQESIEFYKRRGAADITLDEGWRLFKINKSSLFKMSSGPKK